MVLTITFDAWLIQKLDMADSLTIWSMGDIFQGPLHLYSLYRHLISLKLFQSIETMLNGRKEGVKLEMHEG